MFCPGLKVKFTWSDMMETGKQKFVLGIIVLLLLASILVFFYFLQMRKNMISPVSAEPSVSFIDITDLKNEIDSIDQGKVEDIVVSKYKFDENFKDMIANRNIFELIEKIEDGEEIQEDDIEEIIVDDFRETNKEEGDYFLEEEFYDFEEYNTEFHEEPNPFYLQGVSINQYDRMAIIINKYNSVTYLIKPGITVDGYYVESIDLNEIILEKDGQKLFVGYR